MLARKVLLLDLDEHVVEAVDQKAQLVVRFLDGPERVVLLPGHPGLDLCQVEDRPRDHLLELRGEEERDDQGAQGDQGQDHDVALLASSELGQVGLEEDGSQPATRVVVDPLEDLEAPSAKGVPVGSGLGGDVPAQQEILGVVRDHGPAGVEEDRHLGALPLAQGVEGEVDHLLGHADPDLRAPGLGIQGRPDQTPEVGHVGLDVGHHLLAEGDVVVGHEAGGGQDDGQAARDENDERELLPDGQVAQLPGEQ